MCARLGERAVGVWLQGLTSCRITGLPGPTLKNTTRLSVLELTLRLLYAISGEVSEEAMLNIILEVTFKVEMAIPIALPSALPLASLVITLFSQTPVGVPLS